MKQTVQDAAGLLDWLLGALGESSRTHVKKLLAGGKVRVNGSTVTHFATALVPGDVVEVGGAEVVPGAGGKAARTRQAPPFTVLTENEYLVAVDKPVGITTKSDDGSASVFATLRAWYKAQGGGLWMVHRLDKEVSGVVVFARTEEARAWLIDHWREGSKIYLALVEGRPPAREGTRTTYLVENRAQRMYECDGASEGAKVATSHWRTLREVGRHALLELRLDTGRKNQLRVHCAAMGCPIVGDRKYGSVEKDSRVMLHARRLELPLPPDRSGRSPRLVIESPLPGIFGPEPVEEA